MSPASFGVRKPVVANLIMFSLIGAGIVFGVGLRREFFPEVRPTQIVITAPYPGADPDEVERSLARKIEDPVSDLEGVTEITTQATEGAAAIRIEYEEGVRIEEALAEVKREIDALEDLPEESERIRVDKFEPNLPVISLSIFGDADERTMKRAIRKMRDDLRTLPGMGDIAIGGVRGDEILVEVRPEALVEHKLSLPDIASRVRQAMQELPGGTVRSATSNVTVRPPSVDERADSVRNIVVKGNPGGQVLRLGEIAAVKDGFVDVDLRARLNGKPAVTLTAFKVGNQDAVEIAEMVKAYKLGREKKEISLKWTEQLRMLFRPPGSDEPVSPRLRAYQLGYSNPTPPPGELEVTTDLARFIVGRLELLSRNALWGGLLVFLTLVLLLNWRVAFWTALGLVVSLMGTLTAMHFLGITLNLLTMFGLIVVIGLLVDDAIVVAENITSRHERGEPAKDAAIKGTNQVGWPVVTTVLTTICAFLPLALIEGNIGDLLRALPIVVTVALLVSLVEALIILPSHMAHSLKTIDDKHEPGHAGILQRLEFRFDEMRDRFFKQLVVPNYTRFLKMSLKYRYLTLTVAVSLLIASLGMVAGGRLKFTLFETSDSETVVGELRMPIGTPVEETDRLVKRVEEAVLTQPEVASVYSLAGALADLEGRGDSQQSHLGQVFIELKPVELRDRTSEQINSTILRELGPLPGVKSFRLEGIQGGGDGPSITLTVTGERLAQMLPVVERLKDELAEFDGVRNITDDSDSGQRELRFRLLEDGAELGLTEADVARQVRGAVFGLEAHTFAGNREDVDVRVMLPETERRSLAAIERMRILTPSGDPVPLNEVVEITEGEGFASVRRLDRKRAITVTADVDGVVANPEEIMADLRPAIRAIERENPSIRVLERGRQEEFKESFQTLPIGMAVAAGLIFVVLAWLFQSYLQPLFVMMAIPFAIIGMIWGHIILGFSLTFLSLIGFVALSGVVVNDSLIFTDFYNSMRQRGHSVFDAAVEAGQARVRAIILTTVTTVLGLMPLMLEQSFQARFLIPMAITITCGLISATLIVLVVLPSLLLIGDDLRRLAKFFWSGEYPARRPSRHLDQAPLTG